MVKARRIDLAYSDYMGHSTQITGKSALYMSVSIRRRFLGVRNIPAMATEDNNTGESMWTKQLSIAWTFGLCQTLEERRHFTHKSTTRRGVINFGQVMLG